MKTTNTTPPHEPSHRSPSAIERDIARARESMDSTLDELAQKIDPRSRIESAESWVREKAEDIDLDTVKDTASDWARKGARGVRDNPVPVALTALALASFFIPKRSNGSSSNGSSLMPGTGDSSDSFREKSRDELRSIRESVDDSVEEAKARADDLSSRTTAKARRIADACVAGQQRRRDFAAQGYVQPAANDAVQVEFSRGRRGGRGGGRPRR